MDYVDIYKRRLNRYGLDYQSRIQGQRERDFDNYLLKSIYRVDFWYNNIYTPATLERYKQDYSETQSYLLTKREVDIPNGTMLTIDGKNGEQVWMVWWKENIESSGYNRYVVLKMTHQITWRDTDENEHTAWAFFSGPGTSTISDALKSAKGEAVYKENNNLYMFITAYDKTLVRDAYFEHKYGETTTGYIIAEVDIASTPGIAYVSIDPSYIRQKQSPSSQNEVAADQYWLQGGNQ